MAYPYGAVNQSLQNLAGTFERLGGRQMQHKQAMAELGLRGEQMRGKQAMDRAKMEYEQWLNTPMSVRDAIRTSPNLSKNPEAQKTLLQLVEQEHRGLGGKKIGDIMASPGQINQVLGEWRQWQMSDKAKKEDRAFRKEIFGMESDDAWKRLISSQEHDKGRDRRSRIHDLAMNRLRKNQAFEQMMHRPNWQYALGPDGKQVGWLDLQNPERFRPVGSSDEGGIGKGGKPSFRGGGGGGGVDYIKDPYYKEVAASLVGINEQLMQGGRPDPIDATKVVPFSEEERKRMEREARTNYDELNRYWHGYGNNPEGWQAYKSDELKKERGIIKDQLSDVINAVPSMSLEDIERTRAGIERYYEGNPMAVQLFDDVAMDRVESLRKQEVRASGLKRQKRQAGTKMPGYYNWFDRQMQGIYDFDDRLMNEQLEAQREYERQQRAGAIEAEERKRKGILYGR